MSRPTNKKDLLLFSQQNFDALIDFVASIPDSLRQNEFPKGTMNRNIRDVLAHLHHWHLMFLDWYVAGMKGQKPDIPAKGYTWKTTPELNLKIRNDYQRTDLDEVIIKLKLSFQEVRKIIDKHSDAELFEKGKYTWTGTTSLGAYLVSATSSHYDWALKLIKKATKTALPRN